MPRLNYYCLILAAGLAGCATSSSPESGGVSASSRMLATVDGASVLPTVDLDELRNWDCQKYLSVFRPSAFAPTALQNLNIAEFSVKTAIDGYPASLDLTLSELVSGSSRAREYFRRSAGRPWAADLALFPEPRRILRDSILEKYFSNDWEGWSRRSEDAFGERGPADWKLASEVITRRTKHFAGRRQTDLTTDAALHALCGFHVRIWDVLNCVSAIKQILSDMMPTSGGLEPITLIDEFGEFLADARNYPVLLEINRELDALIRGLNQSKDIEPGLDLFRLVERSYQKQGFNKKEAYDQTWKFLGIYSTSGGNIAARSAQLLGESLPNYQVSELLAFFAVSSGVLDAELFFRGRPLFSIPLSVQSTVHTGKPYHFWMSAYLARKNVLLGRSESGSSAAAWLAQLGYQMRSTTVGRDPKRALSTPAFGVANNKIRLDLAYASNGAVYGARSASALSTARYSVDETVRILLASGEDLPPLDEKTALALVNGNGMGLWKRWTEIFAPRSAFRFVKDGQRGRRASQ